MKISLKRTSGAAFSASNERGQTINMDGPESVGGSDSAMRPMEIQLVALGGCMSVDILHILQKGRHEIQDVHIEVEATRKDEIPAIFDTIFIDVTASGSFDQGKLERAVSLSLEKYCSVAKMLGHTTRIEARRIICA